MPHQRLFLFCFVAFSACEPTDLNAADDGGGEGRVVLRAQHDGVHQNKAAEQRERGGTLFPLLVQGSSKFSSQAVLPHDTGEHKLHQEHQIGPALKR